MDSRALFPFAFAFLILVCAPTGASDLETARTHGDKGEVREAESEYRGWLAENGEDESFVAASLELASLLSYIPAKRDVLVAALRSATPGRERHTTLRELAVTSEQLGDLPSAQRYYRDASFALPDEKDFESLLSSALISFELADYRNAEAQSRVITETGKSPSLQLRSEVLLSRIYVATNRDELALSLLIDSAGESPREDLQADGLFWLHRIALGSRAALANEALELLQTRYPDSIETAIALDRASRMPSPSLLLDATIARSPTSLAPATTLSEVSTDSAVFEDQSTRVQTGSFSVRENAEFAMADLVAAGFRVSIEERIVSGTSYYRVLIPEVASDNLDRVLLELREKGFEGFPIYE